MKNNRREIDLVVQSQEKEGEYTIWRLMDHKSRLYKWKTKSSRSLEIGRGYIMKASISLKQGEGWALSNPYFV